MEKSLVKESDMHYNLCRGSKPFWLMIVVDYFTALSFTVFSPQTNLTFVYLVKEI